MKYILLQNWIYNKCSKYLPCAAVRQCKSGTYTLKRFPDTIKNSLIIRIESCSFHFPSNKIRPPLTPLGSHKFWTIIVNPIL